MSWCHGVRVLVGAGGSHLNDIVVSQCLHVVAISCSTLFSELSGTACMP